MDIPAVSLVATVKSREWELPKAARPAPPKAEVTAASSAITEALGEVIPAEFSGHHEATYESLVDALQERGHKFSAIDHALRRLVDQQAVELVHYPASCEPSGTVAAPFSHNTTRLILEAKCVRALPKLFDIRAPINSVPKGHVGPKTINEWASIFDKHPSTLNRWKKNGKLRCYTEGQDTWIHPDDVNSHTPK